MSEHDLLLRLESRYPIEKGWGFFPHIRNQRGFGTGHKQIRTADAIAIGLWKSTGHPVHGFEVKCTNRDFKREMEDPSKSDAFARFCNHWWIVTPNKDVVSVDELPPAWGLMVGTPKGGLRIAKQAPALDPVPLDKDFAVSIVAEQARRRKQDIDTIRREEKQKAEDHFRKHGRSEVEHELRARLQRYKRDNEHFRNASNRMRVEMDGCHRALQQLTGSKFSTDMIRKGIELASKLGSYHIGSLKSVYRTLENVDVFTRDLKSLIEMVSPDDDPS